MNVRHLLLLCITEEEYLCINSPIVTIDTYLSQLEMSLQTALGRDEQFTQ